MSETRKLAAILAADVVGFSRLAGADEDGTLARLRALRSELVDPAIDTHRGRVVKRTGDGVLAEFRSVVDAVRCAIELQSAMVERNAGLDPDRRIEFRIGIHLGDVVEESDGDLMGDGVNIAARLEGVAKPGAICLSVDAYRQVRARLDRAVIDLGETRLKNIAEPVHVYSVEVGAPAQAKPTPAAASPAQPPPLSIAVLAFNNMSGDPEQEYFSDGISEDIITDLSRLSKLHVVARNSSFVYKKSPVSVPDVAKALGVRYVLEGSVRKAGNRVRVAAQLIDSTTGGHVWANRFDRELTDIFAIQDELTKEIVSALKCTMTMSEQNRMSPRRGANIEAYELLLRGREHMVSATAASLITARGLFERAVAIDSGYAAAHAMVAFTHVIDYANGFTRDPDESLRLGLETAKRALKIDDTEPSGYAALCAALMWSRDLDGARAAAERAIVLAPSFAEGYRALAVVQTYAGEPERALASLDAYTQRDPYYPDITMQFIADAHFALGEYEEAIKVIEQRLARNPHSETAYALLASCYGMLGQAEACRSAWDETLRIRPDFSMERRRRVMPFRNPKDFERRVEGLHRSGIEV